jgi:hypothetical protein
LSFIYEICLSFLSFFLQSPRVRPNKPEDCETPMVRFDSLARLDAGLRFDQPAGPSLPSQPHRRTMSLIKLDLQNKDVLEKIELGDTHTAAMVGNANYPDAKRVPTDAEVAAALQALKDRKADTDAAELAWKEQLRLRNEAEDGFDVVITARANNCEAITPGNAAALAGVGLPLRAEPVAAGPLGAPQNLRATMGDMDAEIDLMWDRLKGSASNVVEYRQ